MTSDMDALQKEMVKVKNILKKTLHAAAAAAAAADAAKEHRYGVY